MKIGIFDSGMGGLSVLHRALRMIPEADFLYYADEEHVPYGEKTREQVRGYIDEIIAFMIKEAGRCDCDCLQYSYECGHKRIQKSVSTADCGHGTGSEKSSRRIC